MSGDEQMTDAELKAERRREYQRNYMREYSKTHKPDPAKTREYQRRYYEKNRAKALEAQRAWRKKNPDKKSAQGRRYREKHGDRVRKRALERYHKLTLAEKLERSLRSQCRVYGITVEDYQVMEKRQEGKCAVCRTAPTDVRLDIDHDHDTGEVRGLLCRRCNLSVGLLERGGDELVSRLMAYIQRTLN